MINNKNDGKRKKSMVIWESIVTEATARERKIYYIITIIAARTVTTTTTTIIIIIIMRRSDYDDNAPTQPGEKTAPRNDTDDKSNLYITRVEARAKCTQYNIISYNT
jgi:hypothetical protein